MFFHDLMRSPQPFRLRRQRIGIIAAQREIAAAAGKVLAKRAAKLAARSDDEDMAWQRAGVSLRAAHGAAPDAPALPDVRPPPS